MEITSPAEMLEPAAASDLFTEPAPEAAPMEAMAPEAEAAAPAVAGEVSPPADLGPAVSSAAARISEAVMNGIGKEELAAIIREAVEAVVWEVVPALAEAMIEERILQMEQMKTG